MPTNVVPPPSPTYVTGCSRNWPMLDRHGKRIQVGDRIRYQYCIGEYGKTAIREAVVHHPHYPYGQIEDAAFEFDSTERVLRGYHHHKDFEHGHETWVEVIS